MGIFSRLFKTKKSTPAPDFKIKGDKVEVKVGDKVITKSEDTVKTESRFEPEQKATVDTVSGYVSPKTEVGTHEDHRSETKPKTTAKKSTSTKKTTTKKADGSTKSASTAKKSTGTKPKTTTKKSTNTAKPKVTVDK